VIKQIAITGRSKRTSARNIEKVDAGIASLAESLEAPMIEACSVRRRGFFNGCGTSDGAGAVASRGATQSVPVRLARRRSIAGPIPVVFSATGRYRCTH
jgi:hypothetical protein